LCNIDRLVYHLYGLTYDEVLIIDSTPPFLRSVGSKQQSRAYARRVRKRRKMKVREKKNAKTCGGYRKRP
jgi:hypothetical protein